MAINDLAVRFTEETYATKLEVSRELRMSLIDNIWSNILKYRSNYYRYLPIKSVDKNQLMICYCQSVGSSIHALDGKLLKHLGDYVKISSNSGNLSHFEDMCLISSLRSVARKHDLNVSDIHLRSLIQGDLRDLSLDKRVLRQYLKAIRFIKAKHDEEITIDYLAELYSAFTENPELTSFYREVDDRDPNNRVLIDRVYSSAPVAFIEGMMNSLFNFIISSSLEALVRGIITYYYFLYIKPFPSHNEELALLLFKSVIANGGLGDFGAIIPIENLLNLSQETFNRICTEVQKTNDITYFVNYIIKSLDSSLEELANIKALHANETVRRDFYREDIVEEPATVVQPRQEVPAAPTQVEREQPKPEPVVKPIEPVKPTPVVQPEPARAESRPVTHELAFSQIPEVLDEKAAARLEEHLLEMDPSLKKGEAYFYARHCTMHMNYTIAQYKKALGCAYETARTSMEHLVELHYYEKNQIKNKFVYTPIKR